MPLSLNSGKVRAYSVDLAVLATGAARRLGSFGKSIRASPLPLQF